MYKQFYFFTTVICIAILGFLVTMLYGVGDVSEVFAGDGTSGDPYTICDAGCDYTNIQAAVNTIAAGSYVEVQAGYNSSTESWPIGFTNENITLTCSDRDVVIGPTTTLANPYIAMSTSSILTGCTFGSSEYGMTVRNGGNAITIATNTIRNTTIEAPSSSTIHNNTISMTVSSSVAVVYGADVSITSNTIQYAYTGTLSSQTGVFSDHLTDKDNLLIASNTISIADPGLGLATQFFNWYKGGTNVQILGNKFKYTGGVNYQLPFQLYFRGSATSSLRFTHNTVYFSDFSFSNGNVMTIEDDTTTETHPLFATSTYNVFYNDGAGTSTQYAVLSFSTDVASSVLYEDFNAYTGVWRDTPLQTNGDAAVAVTEGGNSFDFDASPIRTGNVSTADDFQLVPYSVLINVHGTQDVGAIPVTSRGSTFTVDDTCVIDYNTCHATSTDAIAANIFTGDTWALAAGTYSPIALTTSSYATSSITIDGAGKNTIINGNVTSPYGISVTGFSDAVIRDVVVQNASSTKNTYSATNMIFDYGGNSYDANVGAGVGVTILVTDNATCDTVSITSDDTDVTDYVVGSNDWHLALSDFGGNKITVLVPNNIASSESAVLAGGCGGAGITIDRWITSTFAFAGGVFTYDNEAIADAGVSVTPGYTSPPAISSVQEVGTGIKLTDTGTVTITNVTSTANIRGIDISTLNGSVTVNSSTIQNSTAYDVFASTTQNHTFNNVVFTVASTSISNVGTITGKYTTRAFVQNANSAALGGVEVSFVDRSIHETTYVTTTESGYTPYSLLTAFVLSNATTSSVISGGYNPYTVTAAATSSYVSSSTIDILSSVGKVYTLTLDATPETPSPAMIAFTLQTPLCVGTPCPLNYYQYGSWLGVDNADGYILRYYKQTEGLGSAQTVLLDSASTSYQYFTDLSAYENYIIQIASYNEYGTSTYSPAASYATAYAIPGTPIASVIDQNTIDLSWASNGNIVTTTYTAGRFGGGVTSTVSYEVRNATVSTTVNTTAATSTTVTGLTAETGYQFQVRVKRYIDVNDGPFVSTSTIYTEYSELSSIVTTTIIVDDESSPSSGSSGGGGYMHVLPKLNETVDAMNGALVINNNDAKTTSRTVSLQINATDVYQMAISNSSDFTNAAFVPFVAKSNYVLSPGNGEKTVYVKLRSIEGATLTIVDSILLTGQDGEQAGEGESELLACPLDADVAYKSTASNAVYYITTSCTKRPFKRSDIFFTYFRSWDDVRVTSQTVLDTLPEDLLGFMPWGPLYNPASGALIKVPNDAKVYFLLDKMLYHIADEAAATYQFGPNWNTWIDTVDPRLKQTYTISSIILGNTMRLDGMLIKYDGDTKVYRLETVEGVQKKRWIVDEETFASLSYRFDRIVTISASEVYPDGDVIRLNSEAN